jgi:hypothetical protein
MPWLARTSQLSLLGTLLFGCTGEPPTAIPDEPVPVSPQTGRLLVTSTTSGTFRDPDGYAVYVDDLYQQFIGAHDSTTIRGLLPGDHSLRVMEVAGNCTVDGPTSHPFVVRPSETTKVDIVVSCGTPTPSQPPPPTGLEIQIVDSGVAPANAPFTLTIAGATCIIFDVCLPFTRTVNLTEGTPLALTSLSPVLHTLTLVPPSNCSLTGTNPQRVLVVVGKIRPVTFWAKCQ